MLRSAAVARIQQGLGFRSDLEDNIISALQEAQRELESGVTLPWFLIAEDQSLTLTSGDGTVSLPSDFLREVDYKSMRYTPSGSTAFKFIEKKPYPNALEAYNDADAAGPKVYSLRGTTLEFFPTPDTTYTLTWDYYYADTVLTTNVANQWLTYAPDYLLGRAGMKMAMDLRDADGLKLFTDLFAVGKTRLLAETIEREEAAGRTHMGVGL